MRIAVMSDLHDNVKAWGLIAKFLADQQIQTLINCGDTAAPAMLKEMSRTFAGQIHTVFGNVADRELEAKVARDLPNVTHYGDRGELTLAGQRIFFNHFPAVAEAEAGGGSYDFVCHGHTHLKRWEPKGATMILNPGTAGGMFQYPTFAVVDLATMTCNFEDVKIS